MAREGVIRCEDCGHPGGPLSEGTWEGGEARFRGADLDWALHRLRQGNEVSVSTTNGVHFSPCDEGCRHGGPGRVKLDATGWRVADDVIYREGVGILHVVNGQPVEASWRQVAVRRLAYPNMIRPGDLAVLCLRCWAARS